MSGVRGHGTGPKPITSLQFYKELSSMKLKGQPGQKLGGGEQTWRKPAWGQSLLSAMDAKGNDGFSGLNAPHHLK
jgi:hypothetical protein